MSAPSNVKRESRSCLKGPILAAFIEQKRVKDGDKTHEFHWEWLPTVVDLADKNRTIWTGRQWLRSYQKARQVAIAALKRCGQPATQADRQDANGQRRMIF